MGGSLFFVFSPRWNGWHLDRPAVASGGHFKKVFGCGLIAWDGWKSVFFFLLVRYPPNLCMNACTNVTYLVHPEGLLSTDVWLY